jgi:hypothetical protein
LEIGLIGVGVRMDKVVDFGLGLQLTFEVWLNLCCLGWLVQKLGVVTCIASQCVAMVTDVGTRPETDARVPR